MQKCVQLHIKGLECYTTCMHIFFLYLSQYRSVLSGFVLHSIVTKSVSIRLVQKIYAKITSMQESDRWRMLVNHNKHREINIILSRLKPYVERNQKYHTVLNFHASVSLLLVYVNDPCVKN